MILSLKHKRFDDVVDSFNPANKLSGYLCLEQGPYYGALLLTHINGMQCKEQMVLSVPKMGYPYNPNTFFVKHTKSEVAPVYVKYDGTCVIGYAYEFRGKEYITYKTRLTPVMQSYKFLDFVSMWKRILEKYPAISEFISMDQTLIMELWGAQNKHLILYDVPLEAVLLFGINRKTNKYFLPEEIQWDCGGGFYETFPIAEKKYEIKRDHDFPSFYQRIRGELEATNKVVEDGIKGMEGMVIYDYDETWGYVHWKIKPDSVMAEHCKPGLSKNDILTTCYNALENVEVDNLTFEVVKELLAEESQENEIMFKEGLVRSCIEIVKKEMKFRKTVVDKYRELGLNLTQDKVNTMRTLSKYFERGQMKRVYSALLGEK